MKINTYKYIGDSNKYLEKDEVYTIESFDIISGAAYIKETNYWWDLDYVHKYFIEYNYKVEFHNKLLKELGD